MNDDKNKIENLKQRLQNIESAKEKKVLKKSKTGAGFAFKISTEIIAALIVGVGIGLIVDNFFNTKPFGLIIFFIFGAFAGFLNVYRVMRRIEKH